MGDDGEISTDTTLPEKVQDEARRVREGFLDEFESSVLTGKQGEARRQCGRQLLRSFVRIPGGLFRMGSRRSEQPRYEDEKWHKVRVRKFKMGKYPVTNEEFELYDPSHRARRWNEGDDSAGDVYNRYPAVCVTWYDAYMFCCLVGASLSVADGGGVGACLSGREQDEVLLWR